MIALIDGDIVAYRSSASVENIPTLVELAAMGLGPDDRERLITWDMLEVALLRVDERINEIIHETGADSYKIFLSGEGKNNFRKILNPDYKANRDRLRRPHWLQHCNEYLVTEWNAIVCDGIEADDALGIHQTYHMNPAHAEETSIICSIDKDLLQIPGLHYNFVKKEFRTVTLDEGNKFFWKQMLIGDTADNIIGVHGIGPVGANKLIDPLEHDDEMYQVVYDLYNNHERFNMNYRCLNILKEELEDEEIPI